MKRILGERRGMDWALLVYVIGIAAIMTPVSCWAQGPLWFEPRRKYAWLVGL
jgi:hypothetical protein